MYLGNQDVEMLVGFGIARFRVSRRKAVAIRGRGGLYGRDMSRIPFFFFFLENRLVDGDEVVSPMRRPRFIPLERSSGTHFY
jgi:hypothetical protein